jgi:hypothetical protein
MASKVASKKKRSSQSFPTVHTRAAGIDIGSRFHVVAVAPDLAEVPVQTFNGFTGDLHLLADWLMAVGVTTVAMESTGIYWIPLFEILEARGLEVLLVNARQVKQVPGRKTDVNDAQWLQQLHQFGLLRGSFHPAQDVAALRAYLRQKGRPGNGDLRRPPHVGVAAVVDGTDDINGVSYAVIAQISVSRQVKAKYSASSSQSIRARVT